MNLYFNTDLIKDYRNPAQIIRVLTEDWLAKHICCPCCGASTIQPFQNNQPVGDFYCQSCQEQYELKSKNGKTLGNKIADGAYHTMIERITSDLNPNFFFLNYDKRDLSVKNLILVPKHFFTTDMIIPRQKGIPNRPNYIMCSIDIQRVPTSGKIHIIQQGKIIDQAIILQQWQQYLFLRNINNDNKKWQLSILHCLDQIQNEYFSLKEMYAFETTLALQYPNNHFIKDKIRQQLQFLRDKGMIEFLGRGHYRKVIHL